MRYFFGKINKKGKIGYVFLTSLPICFSIFKLLNYEKTNIPNRKLYAVLCSASAASI